VGFLYIKRWRASFAGTKNCGGEKRSGESEGGQKFLPPNPLPFCPPERNFSEVGVGIFLVESSNFF